MSAIQVATLILAIYAAVVATAAFAMWRWWPDEPENTKEPLKPLLKRDGGAGYQPTGDPGATYTPGKTPSGVTPAVREDSERHLVRTRPKPIGAPPTRRTRGDH